MKLQDRATSVEIDISEGSRVEVAEGLSRLFADTYTLYLTTHSFYWNVTGSLLQTLYTLFEEQYTELAEAINDIAARIRSLGFWVPGTYSELAQLSSVPQTAGVPTPEEMVALLAESNETVVKTVRATLPLARLAGDGLTVDLLTQRKRRHERNAWKLRCLLQD